MNAAESNPISPVYRRRHRPFRLRTRRNCSSKLVKFASLPNASEELHSLLKSWARGQILQDCHNILQKGIKPLTLLQSMAAFVLNNTGCFFFALSLCLQPPVPICSHPSAILPSTCLTPWVFFPKQTSCGLEEGNQRPSARGRAPTFARFMPAQSCLAHSSLPTSSSCLR